MRVRACVRACVRARVRACVCVCVVSVIVERPVLPPCVVDGRSRNRLSSSSSSYLSLTWQEAHKEPGRQWGKRGLGGAGGWG